MTWRCEHAVPYSEFTHYSEFYHSGVVGDYATAEEDSVSIARGMLRWCSGAAETVNEASPQAYFPSARYHDAVLHNSAEYSLSIFSWVFNAVMWSVEHCEAIGPAIQPPIFKGSSSGTCTRRDE